MSTFKIENMTVRKRFFTFVKIIFKIILDFRKENILIKKRGYKYAQERMKKNHEKRAQELYDTAIKLKGALIKLCQFLSSRVDVLPEPYIRILKPLQDNVPPVKFESIEKVIQSEYKDYKLYFKEIDKTPVASASLAQVHAAILHNGQKVALKILKPGIERIIDIDFAIIYYVFKILSQTAFFRERVQFNTLFEDFLNLTGDELNFQREAYIIKRFKKHFLKFNHIKIPGVFDEYCTPRIIVMEYLEGDKVSNADLWLRRNNDPGIIAKRIIEFYAEQIFFMELVHYDPHPGNILILDNSNIGIVDFGMSGRISEQMRTGLWEAVDSFLKKDIKGLINALGDLGFFSKGFNKYLLIPILEFLFDEIYEVISNVQLNRESIRKAIVNIDFSPILDKLIQIIYTHAITLPANWVYIGKTVGTLIGLIASLDPDFKIFEELKPYVKRYSRNNYHLVISKYYNSFISNLKTLITMPDRLNDFIDKIESGSLNIKIDYSEIKDKIDEFKEFIIRVASFFVCSVSAVSSFVFYKMNYKEIYILFLMLACISLVVSLVYRKGFRKKEIKHQIEKLI